MTLTLENNSNLLETTWQQSIQQIQKEIDPEVFAAFLNPVRFVTASPEEQSITISAPSELIKSHLENKFSDRIKSYFSQKLGSSEYRLIYQIQDSSNTYTSLAPNIQKKVAPTNFVAEPELDTKGNSFKTNLNPEYTFENFVVGQYNEFAYGLAKQLANSKQSESCSASPLFFHGGVGLGKTHLMQAIGHQFLRQNPEARVYYTSSENFTNKLIGSIRTGQVDKFKKQIRSIDLLLIDDFQFLAKKQHTQEEFFHTFNSLHERGSKIVIVADKLPQELSDLDEKLKSRLSWGVTVDFQNPDQATRLAIVKSKAKQKKIFLDRGVAELIAERVTNNIRELEGAINRITALASLRRETININLAQQSLDSFVKPKKLEVSFREIKSVVANYFELKVGDLESKRRLQRISFARQIAVYLIRKHTSIPYLEIGLYFGGRDHSSIIYASQKIEKELLTSAKVKLVISEIENKILS